MKKSQRDQQRRERRRLNSTGRFLNNFKKLPMDEESLELVAMMESGPPTPPPRLTLVEKIKILTYRLAPWFGL